MQIEPNRTQVKSPTPLKKKAHTHKNMQQQKKGMNPGQQLSQNHIIKWRGLEGTLKFI